MLLDGRHSPLQLKFRWSRRVQQVGMGLQRVFQMVGGSRRDKRRSRESLFRPQLQGRLETQGLELFVVQEKLGQQPLAAPVVRSPGGAAQICDHGCQGGRGMFFDEEGQSVPENNPNQVLPVLPVSEASLILGPREIPASGLALGPGNRQGQDQKQETGNHRSHVQIVAIGVANSIWNWAGNPVI